MFGEKSKKIARLEQANADLEGRIAAIEGDPAYALARELTAGIEEILKSGVNVETRINDLVAERRAQMIDARTLVLAEAEARRRIAAEQRTINEAAQLEARVLATRALHSFLADDAMPYREKVSARLNASLPASVVKAAQAQIEAEEHQLAVDRAKDDILAKQGGRNERQEMKQRASELRRATKVTHWLDLSELQPGDPLTLVFTEAGKGFEPLTSGDRYSSTYQSNLERRKVAGHLIVPMHGLFEVEGDSWFKDPQRREQSLRGGQRVHLMAENPLHADAGPYPNLVKGAPLTFENLGGVAMPGADLHLWWANLGDFRVLS